MTHFEVYRTKILRQWRWRLRAGNGKIIAHGGEGYANEADCMHAVTLVMETTLDTPVAGMKK